MVRMNIVDYRYIISTILAFLVVLISAGNLTGAPSPPPLLLSLDVERNTDVQSLEKLGLNEPATYFVTGEFARQFPKVVHELSKNGTIGSHSHSHPYLTRLETEEIRMELLTSAQAIESATGQAPLWFRAPFLEVNDEILSVAREVGFRYDSSESERWIQQQVMAEIPISINATDRILISDYDIFSVYGLDNLMALDMLKENYISRLETGRPLIFLLHPSVIAEHADVLHSFINFVKEQGGSCLSFDQYSAQTFAESPVDIGIRIDPRADNFDAKRTISDMIALQVTDVFVLARDTSGYAYYRKDVAWNGSVENQFGVLVQGLRDAGIRTHAWIPVLQNSAAIKQYPDQAMVDGNRKPSQDWVSPSHPHTLNTLEQSILELLDGFPIDGIHLDALTYPSLKYDFSPLAIKRFEQDTGITIDRKKAASILPSNHYNEWTRWRSSQIERIAQIAAITASRADRDVFLSATLNSSSLTNFREMETSGQDYRLLAEYLDMIITVPDYDNSLDKMFSLSQIIHISRSMMGQKSLMISLPEQFASNEKRTAKELADGAYEFARYGSDGVLFPSYQWLSSQAKKDPGLYDGILKMITALRQPLNLTTQKEQTISVLPVPEAHASQGTSITEENPQAVSNSQAVVAHLITSRDFLPMAAVAAGLSLFAFLAYCLFVRNRHSLKDSQANLEKDVTLDWQEMEQLINDDEISGQLVHIVAQQLRTYDPVNTSRYRIALIIDMVVNAGQQLSVNNLITIESVIPGWHVLAMSHLKEGVIHGYLHIDQDQIEVTQKGIEELATMKKSGFDLNHWTFVEQRLHESLVITCSHCGEINSAHWYWTNFSCSKCGRDSDVLDCNAIVRKTQAGIELDQHSYA